MRVCNSINRMIRRVLLPCLSTLALTILCAASANCTAATFDLVGPRIDVTVTRSGKTLPISSVANLNVGDILWIHPDFPSDQSVHYLLIVAFLQGPTNPPPDDWFTRVETWTKKIRQEGVNVKVPQGAQQALLFLAPETGGDFSTLRSTTRARPGVFVRAALDLNLASLDRSRLDKYLDEIRKTSETDPAALKKNSALLAQTLRLKIDEACFNKPLEEQPSCLTQNTDQIVLNDAHNDSLVAMLTSGPSSDLISAVGVTPVARGGYYSSYIGAVVDIARLMNNLHTAVYQYIPALTLPHKNRLDLRLNSPPSFQNPKSVLVVGLPAVTPTVLPPLRPVDPKQVFCLQQSPLILPVEGAPLVFSTAIAHDFILQLQNKSGQHIDLPVTADAVHGGFVVDTHTLRPDTLNSELTGSLRGSWGFTSFDGPDFKFRVARAQHWTVPAAETNALVVGDNGALHLNAGCVPCVEKVSLHDSAGKEMKTTWKAVKPDELEVELPLKDQQAGQMKLTIKQFGLSTPDVVELHALPEAAHLQHFTINAGDHEGRLTGSRLTEVASLELNGVHFVPGKLADSGNQQSLEMVAATVPPSVAFQPEQKLEAHATLKDGRVINLQTVVESPRPRVTLVSKSVQPGTRSSIRLGNADELPQNGRLTFFLKSESPATFSRSEKIEVATSDSAFDTTLTFEDGNLVLQDSQSVLATFDPAKALGASAFGALRFRPVDENGAKGDWQPLAVLVRIPELKEIRCPDSPEKQCILSGSNLFLLNAVASDRQFKNSVNVAPGYVDATLSVPRPNGTLLYLKLRDDPDTVDTVALPVVPDND